MPFQMPALPQRSESGATKRNLADGIDPSEYPKVAKPMRSGLAAKTFEMIAREWHANVASNKAETHNQATTL